MGSKPVRSKFFIFLEPGKKIKKKIFQEKSVFYRKISVFIRKIGDFCADFFISDFSIPISFPAPPKSDISPKNRPKSAIFLSMNTSHKNKGHPNLTLVFVFECYFLFSKIRRTKKMFDPKFFTILKKLNQDNKNNFHRTLKLCFLCF